MSFLRQLAAVSLVVAVIVALGVGWSRAAGAGPASHPPAGRTAARLVTAGRADGGMLGNPKSVTRTVLVEALLAGVVVAASSTRRRRRQARRRSLGRASP